MSKYSAYSLFKHALSNNQNWKASWRDVAPKAKYDAIIVGGGGHGLATAYYLAKNHGMTNIAVVEKGWIGGGNTARNTTIVRSNYLWTEASLLYEKSLKLWEGLGYYRRARNLLSSSKILVRKYNSKLPNTFEEIKKLPGVGDYTANALLGQVHNKSTIAIDGNVKRVFARILNKKESNVKTSSKSVWRY